MRSRFRVLKSVLVAVILLCYIWVFAVPYIQTFGRGYEFMNHFYANFYASNFYSGRPDRCLTLDGRLLKADISNKTAQPVQISRAICRVPLTEFTFDNLFTGASWTHHGVDAQWLRENCKAAWIGFDLENSSVAMRYILKLKNGDLVVCYGTLFSWKVLITSSLSYAEYYSPNGSVSDFYKLIEDLETTKK